MLVNDYFGLQKSLNKGVLENFESEYWDVSIECVKIEHFLAFLDHQHSQAVNFNEWVFFIK